MNKIPLCENEISVFENRNFPYDADLAKFISILFTFVHREKKKQDFVLMTI